MKKKTDNHNLQAKVALRLYFLRKYHREGTAEVLDCCQGEGAVWREIRKQFEVRSYWGVDTKPQSGRLKLDSVRVLALPGWTQDVIDIDTYGTPWKHWSALIPNLTRPTTIFLTVGQLVRGTVGKLPLIALESLGMGHLVSKIPPAFHVKLGDFSVSSMLTICCGHATIIEAAECESGNRNVRYIGIRLEPKKTASQLVPARPKRTRSAKETEHV